MLEENVGVGSLLGNTEFIAKERFIIDTNGTAGVNISHIGDNFCDLLAHTVPTKTSTSKLVQMVLEEDTFDIDIINRLGGVQRVVSSLSHIYIEIALQPYGPESPKGKLYTNGFANLFYVEKLTNKEAKLGICNVIVAWTKCGWYIDATKTAPSGKWPAGFQVLYPEQH